MTNLRKDVLPRYTNRPVVLFGAGHGTRVLLDYLEDEGARLDILFIVDNDRSMWGKEVCGLEIRPPEEILQATGAAVLITSVSGLETIAAQLEGMGLRRGDDYEAVATYGDPRSAIHTFLHFRDRLHSAGRGFEGSRVLTVGPGGFLGVEVLIAAAGARRVDAVDPHSFGMVYPDLTNRASHYECLVREAPSSCDRSRLADLFKRNRHRLELDDDIVRFHAPYSVEALPFADGLFDLSFSFSVLEHVFDPRAAVRELVRTLAPGGISVHRVTTRDHRSFSELPGYDAFSLRRMPAAEWEALSRAKFYQNRVIPAEWRRLFESEGALVREFDVLERCSLPPEEVAAFDEPFQRFSLEELGELDCDLVLERTSVS